MWYLKVTVTDTITQESMDALEDCVDGRIISHRDHVCGNIDLILQTSKNATKKVRRDLLHAIGLHGFNRANWFQS